MTTSVTDNTFQAEVLESERPVVVLVRVTGRSTGSPSDR